MGFPTPGLPIYGVWTQAGEGSADLESRVGLNFPTVVDATARDALFPLVSRAADQRVFNKATNQVERWDATVKLWIAQLTPLLTLYDDFERADSVGGGLGVALSGQAWQAFSGAGAAAGGITSGRYVAGTPGASNVCYAPVLLAAKPVRYGARFSFAVGPGGGTAQCAIISSADATATLNKMLHLILSINGWTLSWWNGVSQNNILVATSGRSTFATPLLTDGTVYECWVTVQGNHVHIDLPDGTTADYYDANVPVVSGPLLIFEHAYSVTSAQITRFESVSAYSAAPATFSGPVSFPTGIQGTPIGNVTPATGYFTGLGIGTLQPAAVVHIVDAAGGLDGLRVSHSTTHSAVRVRVTAAGFEPQIWLDQGQANPVKIFSEGSANNFAVMINNSVRFRIPLSGASPIEFLLHPIKLTTAAFAGTGTQFILGGTQQTTVGAAGAAAVLPANPLGYIIAFVGTAKIAIPYYNG